MKRTLITIALTTVVVLTLVGAALFSTMNNFGGAPALEAPSDIRSFAEPAFAPMAPASEPMPMAAESFAMDSGGGMDFNEQAVSNAAATERLVIQNVDMSIIVADPKARMEKISDMAVEMGGFVVSSNLYQSNYGPNNIVVPEANMTIRVPSDQLDAALEGIKEDVVDVTYENRSGQDVTSQYVDLDSRLSAKRAAEKKLLEILDEAKTTEDTLAVYTQLQQIQADIEVLVGQMKYYEESAALSAISINLIAEEKVKPIEIGGWKLQGTANDAIQDLIRFTQGFTQFLIRFVLSFLPALILVAIPVYIVFIGGRALYRRFRRSRPNAEVKEEEKK